MLHKHPKSKHANINPSSQRVSVSVTLDSIFWIFSVLRFLHFYPRQPFPCFILGESEHIASCRQLTSFSIRLLLSLTETDRNWKRCTLSSYGQKVSSLPSQSRLQIVQSVPLSFLCALLFLRRLLSEDMLAFWCLTTYFSLSFSLCLGGHRREVE